MTSENEITSDWNKIFAKGEFSNLMQGEDEHYFIFKFNVNEDIYTIKYSNAKYCCEEFGVKFISKDEKFVRLNRSSELISFKLYYIRENSEDEYDVNQKFIIKFTSFGEFDKKEYESSIEFYNIHNGYYSHKFIILKNDKLIFKSSL